MIPLWLCHQYSVPVLTFNCASFDNGHGLFGLSTYRVHRMVTEKCFLVEPSSKVRGIFCQFSPVFSSFLRPQLSDLAEILVEFWGVVWQCVIQFLLEFDALWLGNGSKTGWDTGRKLRKTRQKLAIASWFSPVLVSLLASLGGNWITNRNPVENWVGLSVEFSVRFSVGNWIATLLSDLGDI